MPPTTLATQVNVVAEGGGGCDNKSNVMVVSAIGWVVGGGVVGVITTIVAFSSILKYVAVTYPSLK